MTRNEKIYAEIIHNCGEDKVTRKYIYRYARAGYLYRFPKDAFAPNGYLYLECPRDKYLIKVY